MAAVLAVIKVSRYASARTLGFRVSGSGLYASALTLGVRVSGSGLKVNPYPGIGLFLAVGAWGR